MAHVLNDLHSLPQTAMLQNNTIYYNQKADQDILFDETLWNQVSLKITVAIIKYTPASEKEFNTKVAKYELKKERILGDFIAQYNLFEGESIERPKCVETSILLQTLGFQFIRFFQNLITPPGQEECMPIDMQHANREGIDGH